MTERRFPAPRLSRAPTNFFTSAQSIVVIGAMREVVIVALADFLIGITAAALLFHFLP